jgi:hypothetical protein
MKGSGSDCSSKGAFDALKVSGLIELGILDDGGERGYLLWSILPSSPLNPFSCIERKDTICHPRDEVP